MADVRALLRQQRAARRLEHPHASYSDAGKLSCTVCQEQIKSELLWDGHLRGAGHRKRLQSLHQATTKSSTNGYAGFVGPNSARSSDPAPSNKRKMADSDEEVAGQDDDDAVRRKRTKGGEVLPEQNEQQAGPAAAIQDDSTRQGPLTPPLTRRTSGTPTIGVEMQIPSRPATPGAPREGSNGTTPMATTPKSAPIGRSPLIPDEPIAPQPPARSATTASRSEPAAAPGAVAVDEDEWAAFEAEMVRGEAGKGRARPAAAAALDSDAVISAPVMSAAEVAAKSVEEERAKRRALVDIQIEDEKEDATQALESEFEVMEELEARARKLRERREALRLQRGGGSAPAVVSADGRKGAAPGKENAAVEEEEEEDDEDDWDGFRFRA
ncbi:hypothetical protein BT67DRAFT_441524 [Trichocladium antarcticum]|uniref:Coiled-coil domain-containing protein 16 n=1 Tax=Trichocladium antarcticum TaxID=1450529 RepID=A0AAN6ZDI4_9PEZI|nr:hypothetical protein BT67DRAFT_441524 [Trichocladium antarcticum]